jgi:hypothetical protein
MLLESVDPHLLLSGSPNLKFDPANFPFCENPTYYLNLNLYYYFLRRQKVKLITSSPSRLAPNRLATAVAILMLVLIVGMMWGDGLGIQDPEVVLISIGK